VYQGRTDLQRLLREVDEETPAGVCFIEGDRVIKGSLIDVQALDAAALEAALRAHGDFKTSRVFFRVRVSPDTIQEQADLFLWDALDGMARRAGYVAVEPSTAHRGDRRSWATTVNSVREALGVDMDGEEQPVALRLGLLYPVRTELTSMLAQESVAVLDLFPALSKETVERRSMTIRDDLRDGLDRAGSKPAGRLAVRLRIAGEHDPGAARAVYQALQEIVTGLGFQSLAVPSIEYTGGAGVFEPRPAPEFRLREPGGESEVSFHDRIDGKVALLTFWGVACGPCRVEAPHLTRLHEMLSPRGFTVVAVNAYNEPEDTVRRYLDAHHLTHPVLLMGRDVARDLYEVNAFPTTFLIDARGQLVERHVGFSADDLPAIEAKIEQLLDEN
jgi:thiol-disulfide isomerase/thioredoxin